MNQFTPQGSFGVPGGDGFSPGTATPGAASHHGGGLSEFSEQLGRPAVSNTAVSTGWGGAPAVPVAPAGGSAPLAPARPATSGPGAATPHPPQPSGVPAAPGATAPVPTARGQVAPQQGAQQQGVPQQGAQQQGVPRAAAPSGGQTAGQAARPPVQSRAAGRIGLSQDRQQGDLALEQVLEKVLEHSASDLHLTVGAPPMLRIAGSLQPIEGFPILEKESLQRSIYQILTQKQRETFEDNLELDFAYSLPNRARFRVNLYLQRESIGAAFRLIPYEIKPLEALGVPPVVGTFAGLPRGLVLVTGPTGSGKSTTLAAVVDLANRTRSEHIMTVEDPIEFLHKHKKALVNQREVGEDTKSFANALKHVLRQDPDIILVGEMRDLETISVALTAAETGHLVFATLHTQDAAQTIDRMIDVFPSHQQEQVRTQLASALQGVVCQSLCKRADGPGRVVATEVMVATPAIRNLIREGKTHQIYSAMQAGANQGMHTLDQHLADLVRIGKITYETGLEKCHHVEDYNRLTGRSASVPQGQSTVGSTGPGY